MSPLEGDDEEEKQGKGLKILMPDKPLIRFPILLSQIKAGNKKNSIFCVSFCIFLYFLHNNITKKVYNNLIKSLK